jgi:hypothetical protein
VLPYLPRRIRHCSHRCRGTTSCSASLVIPWPCQCTSRVPKCLCVGSASTLKSPWSLEFRVKGNTPNRPSICLFYEGQQYWEMRSPKHPILGVSHFQPWSESLEGRISAHNCKRTGFRDNTNRASLPCRPQNCDKKSPLAPEERVTSLWLASHSLD